jgi:hypothetical protein
LICKRFLQVGSGKDNASNQQAGGKGASTGKPRCHRLRVYSAREARMFYVEIVKTSSGEVVERMGPMSERKADKVESGVAINLNHEEYFTRIVPA